MAAALTQARRRRRWRPPHHRLPACLCLLSLSLFPTLLVLLLLPATPTGALKLGTTSPQVMEKMGQQGIDEDALEEAVAEANAAAEAEAAEKKAKMQEELRKLKAAERAREALNEAKTRDWKEKADKAKKERELDEKYGMWKHVILNPWYQWFVGIMDDIMDVEILGEPRMAPAAIIILLYMLYKARQPLSILALTAAFFYSLHPFIIFIVVAGLWGWARVRKPKGYVPFPSATRGGGGNGEEAGDDDHGDNAINGDDDDNDGSIIPRSARTGTAAGAGAGKRRRGQELAEDARDMSTLMTLPKEVDHIVLGSDVGGLYTAALLSRVGHSVVVLESGDSLGNCTSEIKGVEFDWGLHNAGMVHIYDDLLRAATLEGVPEVKWSRIGTEADGYSFDVVRIGNVGDVVYRAGKQALIDDQVTSAPDNRERVSNFVSRMEIVAREQSAFFIGRLFPRGTAGWIQALLGQSYGSAGARSVDQILMANLPDYEQLDILRGLFRTENLLPSEVSFAAYVSAMNHAFEGMNYPQGGFRSVARALVPTIQAAGGRLLTRAKVKQIVLDEEDAPAAAGAGAAGGSAAAAKAGKKATRARGVVLENGQVIRCRKSVISSSGVVPLFTQFLPKTELPPSIEILEEAKPRIYTLYLLKGTAEELDLPASDFYQVPTNETAGGSLSWFHVYFPSAKDPTGAATIASSARKAAGGGTYSTCVIETEADDDVLEVCYRRADGTISNKAPTAAAMQGGQAQGPGLKFYKFKQPSDAKVRRLQQNLHKRLLQLYPQLEGQLEEEQGCTTVGPFRVGLSHRPSRFAAPGLRTSIVPGLENVFLAGGDLVLGTFVGSLLGGWLAAHAALGYGALDLLLLQRNLNNDLKNIPKPKVAEEDKEA